LRQLVRRPYAAADLFCRPEVRPHNSFRVHLDQRTPSPSPRILAEGIHVPLAGQEELQEADSLEPAGLVDGQQGPIITQPDLLQAAWRALPVVGEPPDRVLGIIVVPRHPVMPEEREKFLTVLE